MRFILCLFNSQQESMLYTKLYLRYRRSINEYLYCSNACKNLDKTFLILSKFFIYLVLHIFCSEQWTVIVTRIFSDHQPVTLIEHMIKKISSSKQKDLSQAR